MRIAIASLAVALGLMAACGQRSEDSPRKSSMLSKDQKSHQGHNSRAVTSSVPPLGDSDSGDVLKASETRNGGYGVRVGGSLFSLDLFLRGSHLNPWLADTEFPSLSELELARLDQAIGGVATQEVREILVRKLSEMRRRLQESGLRFPLTAILGQANNYTWLRLEVPCLDVQDDSSPIMNKVQMAYREDRYIRLCSAFGELSPSHQAALLLHELLYASQDRALPVRSLVGFLFHEDFSRFNEHGKREFIDLVTAATANLTLARPPFFVDEARVLPGRLGEEHEDLCVAQGHGTLDTEAAVALWSARLHTCARIGEIPSEQAVYLPLQGDTILAGTGGMAIGQWSPSGVSLCDGLFTGLCTISLADNAVQVVMHYSGEDAQSPAAAARRGDLERLQALARAGVNLSLATRAAEATPLEAAIEAGQSAVVDWLVALPVDLSEGSPISVALKFKRWEIATRLVNLGLQFDGAEPLNAAFEADNIGLARAVLAQGTRPWTPTTRRWGVLSVLCDPAMDKGRDPWVTLFLAEGATCTGDEARTFLQDVIRTNRLETFRAILPYMGKTFLDTKSVLAISLSADSASAVEVMLDSNVSFNEDLALSAAYHKAKSVLKMLARRNLPLSAGISGALAVEDPEVLELVLSLGATPGPNSNPLMTVIERVSTLSAAETLLQVLLRHAEVAIPESDDYFRTICDRSRTKLIPALLPASGVKGRLDFFERLLRASPDANTCGISLQDRDSLAALFAADPATDVLGGIPDALNRAMEAGYVRTAEALVARGADIHLGNPLFHASKQGLLTVIQALLNAGANPNQISEAMTPLYSAIESKNLEAVKRLVAGGAHVHVWPSGDAILPNPAVSPLIYAAQTGTPEIIEFLVASGAPVAWSGEPLSPYDSPKAGVAALHMAARLWQLDKVDALLRVGADINHKILGPGGACRTPLKQALTEGVPETFIRELLRRGADVNPECAGDSPLRLAQAIRDVNIVEILRAAGAR